MNEKEIIDIEQKYMANVYAKKSLTLVKGKGAHVSDINDQEYIDCMAGYGVCIVGHCHPRVVKAIQKEIWNLPVEPATKVRLTEKTGEIEFRITEGSDAFIQLESLIASFVLAGQNKGEP